MEDTLTKDHFAVFVDGDNAQPKLLGKVLQEVARHGLITIKRIYGDWTAQNMQGWKEYLHAHAVQPVQQFRYTTGKNATDSALIIDAMDVLHRAQVQGVAIVSSDSDYTRLATRFREEGMFVIGIGAKKTPKSFVNACDLFVYTENLSVEEEARTQAKTARGRGRPARGPKPEVATPPDELLDRLEEAYEMVAGEDGWAELSQVGTALRRRDPGFDPRTWGFKQMTPLARACASRFEIKETKPHGDVQARLYLRPRGGGVTTLWSMGEEDHTDD